MPSSTKLLMRRRRQKHPPAKVEVGKDAYAALAHPIRRQILTLLAEREGLTFTEIQRELRAATGVLFHRFSAQSSPEAIVLAAFMAWLLSQAKYSCVGLLLIPTPLLPDLWIMASIFLSWFLVSVACEFLALLLIGRRGGQTSLLAGIPISLLPIMVLPATVALETLKQCSRRSKPVSTLSRI